MAKFLVRANYVGEGIQGLLAEGGTSRRRVIERLAASLGGNVECVYYAFGEYDIYGIVDMPDNASMAAFVLKAAASGRVTLNTVALMTTEEIDDAAKKTSEYRPPGNDRYY
jgi:uncharacterized protein with GYD domain